jgi:hypothetical protein
LSKGINEAKAAEIAKACGVNADAEDIKRAMKAGMVPESMLQGDKELVHHIDGKRVNAADVATNPALREKITKDLKRQLQEIKEGKRAPIERDDRAAEDVAKAYFESPAGQRFNDPRFRREIDNLIKRNPVDYRKGEGEWRDIEREVERENG